jgi:hypothetical protein
MMLCKVVWHKRTAVYAPHFALTPAAADPADPERTSVSVQLLHEDGKRRIPSYNRDVKRVMVTVVGAGLGSLLGMLGLFLGVGNSALIIGGVAGAILPHLILGRPSQ